MSIVVLLLCLLLLAGRSSPVVPKKVPKVDLPGQLQGALSDYRRQMLDHVRPLNAASQRDAVAQRQTIERETR